MAASGLSTTVPEGFHYETKYVLLSYLSLPPSSQSRPAEAAGQSAQKKDVEKTSRMKQEIEDELKQLEEEIAASFPKTGFDRHTSPVFSPANPESSIEDSLAVLGDRVAQELDTHLASAIYTLLSGQLDYEVFRAAVQEVSSHSQGGWSKVLVPLVLLQSLQAEGQPLALLLALGVRYLEEVQADFIIQQGGWLDYEVFRAAVQEVSSHSQGGWSKSVVFSLEDVEDPGVIIAEDSNDIYILSEERSPEPLSPPESLLRAVDSSGPGSWQTESLPVSLSGHESWAQVAMMDPEDAKSLDSAEGVALAEERSENNSSNSDIVHVEREEAELLEEGREAGEEEELQESVLSVLGSESELAALRAELREEAREEAPKAHEFVESPDESIVIMEPLVSLAAPAPTAALEPVSIQAPPPPPAAATPLVPDPEPEPLPVQPEPVLAPVEPQLSKPVKEAPPDPAAAAEPQAEPEAEVEPQPEPLQAPPPEQEIPAQEVQALQAQAQEPPVLPPPAAPVQTEPGSSELPVLLYGGAALVAIAAIVAYGALAYRKK